MDAKEVVFAIPELVVTVASFLERQDLSRLMRTNRAIYSLCASQFYQQADIRALPAHARRLIFSREGLEALARNVDFVKEIRMDVQFFDHYYDCLVSAASSGQQQSSGDVEALEGVGNGAGAGEEAEEGTRGLGGKAGLGGVMFPRMTNLSRFEFNLPAPGEGWNYMDLESEDVISKFCYMVPPEQLHRLEILTLNGMKVEHQSQFKDLTRIVAGMTSLRTLRLGIEYPSEIQDEIIPWIFASLPSSIQVFTVRLAELGFQGGWEKSSTRGYICQRDEPLPNLREWDVAFDSLLKDPGPFFLMFPYCLELEMVMVPQMVYDSDEERLATFIIEQCPKISQLGRIDYGWDPPDDNDQAPSDYGNYDGVLQSIAAQAMAPSTLESFDYDGFYEAQDIGHCRLPWLLEAQFDSLTRVHLRNTRSLCRFSVSQLLHLTPVLEFLVIDSHTDKWEKAYGIGLQSLSDVSWATNKLRELRLVVDLGYLSVSPMKYLNQKFSLPRIQDDVAVMSFGSFLANVGKQKDLRVLDLRVATPNLIFAGHTDEELWTYRDESFPGLLSLDGKDVSGLIQRRFRRRSGFLDMLAGLSKLEELRGSVNVNSRDRYGYATGWEVAEWMKKHWPRLRVAEFFPQFAGYVNFPVTDEWLWLQKQLPGLIYTDDHSL